MQQGDGGIENAKRELNENEIRVVGESETPDQRARHQLRTRLGFCGSLFPVFGLGDSAVDGEVELLIDGPTAQACRDAAGAPRSART